MRTTALLLALLGWGALASAAPAPTRVGILPVSGPPQLARRLAAQLPATLPRGIEVVSPGTLARRISRSPDVKRSFLAVRTAVERAEQDTLYMRRTEALSALQRAKDSLDTVAGQYHAPALAARVRGAQALALLLSPADEQRALTAFRLALRADPSYRPDPDRLPSRAARLLAQARRKIPAPGAPSAEELGTLAGLAGVDRLVWIGLRGEDAGVGVELLIYDHGRRAVLARQRATCAADALVTTVARRVEQHLAPPVPPAVTSASQPSRTTASTAPAHRGTTPWYRRWWVWAVAGAVVAGGVTAAVVATVPGDRSYEFRFSY